MQTENNVLYRNEELYGSPPPRKKIPAIFAGFHNFRFESAELPAHTFMLMYVDSPVEAVWYYLCSTNSTREADANQTELGFLVGTCKSKEKEGQTILKFENSAAREERTDYLKIERESSTRRYSYVTRMRDAHEEENSADHDATRRLRNGIRSDINQASTPKIWRCR
jgi:hypothetical protein